MHHERYQNSVTELEHNQVIRVRGVERENRNFLVRTPRGINESAKYGKPMLGHEAPWVIRETQAANASGAQEERSQAWMEAVEIRDGQRVRIEGQVYQVKLSLHPGYPVVEFQRVV